MLPAIRDWVAVLGPLVQSLLILFAIIKVLGKAEWDFRQRAADIEDHESRIRALETENRQHIGLAALVLEMKEEIRRMRDRLDALLDGQAKKLTH